MNDLAQAKVAVNGEARAVGESGSPERLMSLAYAELREMARSLCRRERTNHTLQPTALIHEAFLLMHKQRVACHDLSHFCAVAAMLMRRVLVRHAARRVSAKRGGRRPRTRTPLDAAVDWCQQRCTDVQALDDALKRLAEFDPRQSRIVEMRFFGGLSVEQVAALLAISPRTVHREWGIARAWLRAQIVEGAS